MLPKLFKRCPYRDYSKVEDKIPIVLEHIRKENLERGELSNVSRTTGIPLATIIRWRKNILEDPSFNPTNKKHGQHLRIFTDYEENSIADYIVDNYIICGMYFTDEDFKEIALLAWQEKYLPMLDMNNQDDFKEFHCSAGFIDDFKKNHRFSSKMFHLKRRPESSAEFEKPFLDEITKLLLIVPNDRILNCDETGWKLFPKGILTWSEKGRDHNSRLSLMNDKDQVTVLATITAARTKLPLLFIAEGKTERVEASQIGDVAYHWITHTQNGWMTDESFTFYLMKLREFFNDDDPIHLILDLYKAHLTDNVKEYAAGLNIILHFIPAGMTDTYQPLDRSIFGPFKALARRYFRKRKEFGKPIKITKIEACEDIVAAWESVNEFHIAEAWEIYNGEPDDPRDINDIRIEHHRKSH